MPKKKTLPKQSITDVARERLGFESLRGCQQPAIEALLSARDTLVVQPTGSGKSAIYQIAGLMLDGPVLVISPLIALQKDQLEAIGRISDAPVATVLNSSQKVSEQHSTLELIESGDAKFIFLAPEQLAREQTRTMLKQLKLALIAIDEAHCISEWGHDFRPDYLELGHSVEWLKHPTVLAMTATASERVQEEIVERLQLRKPAVLVGSFDRPNIHLRVDRYEEARGKREALIHRARWADKPGIVYAGTRKAAESVAADLNEQDVVALVYHAGLKAEERTAVQDRFMAGDAEVIVATNAFGMGIDKSNVRFVYHLDAPDSLDAYYQEIGRAGRDGESAQAILFFRDQDIGAVAFHTGSGRVEEKQLVDVVQTLEREQEPVSVRELSEETHLGTRKLATVLHKLEDAGAVEVEEDGTVQTTAPDLDPEAVASQAAGQQDLRRTAKTERLEQVRQYAVDTLCRRARLLAYFGQKYEPPCGNCDVCEEVSGDLRVDPGVGTRREVTD